MSILFINSSPNPHGNTARVAAALLESKEYETLNLAEYKIYGYGQQFPDDQFMEVIDKIRAAKTIVIGSPLYWHNLSGLLRCFLDRTYGPFEQGEFSGRDHLGELAPKFAQLNDDVLFGEVWSREEQLSARDRSMITIAALFSAGLYPQLKSHLALGKEHGITKEEAVEIVTQLAFYCGWPKAWSTFPMIAEIYGD